MHLRLSNSRKTESAVPIRANCMMKGDREKLSTLGFILCPHAKILKIAAEIADINEIQIINFFM